MGGRRALVGWVVRHVLSVPGVDDQTHLDAAWIQTATGVRLNVGRPETAHVVPLDVAWALARVCRFGGHLMPAHYSVAQHSVLVSTHVELRDPALALAALLHDADEYVLGDVVGPLKTLLPDYNRLQSRWSARIAEVFGLVPESLHEPLVRQADAQALATEARDLVAPGVGRDKCMGRADAWSETIVPWTVEQAQHRFLVRLEELVKPYAFHQLNRMSWRVQAAQARQGKR